MRTMLKKNVNAKKLTLICGILVAVVLIAALLNAAEPKVQLSEVYDEEVVIEMSKQAVAYFSEQDYQSMIDMMTKEYAAEHTVDSLDEEYTELLEGCGAFVEYSGVEAIGGTNPETGEEYGGALIEAEYEKKVLRFSIGFNQDMEMRQFLIQ